MVFRVRNYLYLAYFFYNRMNRIIYLLKLLSIVACAILFSCNNSYQDTTVVLTENWEFKNSVSNQWYPAIIPGSIHADLYKNNLIPYPIKGKNEQTLQWIDTCSWIYRTHFEKPRHTKQNDHFELIFDGLDTYADVYLNDSILFSANNMFTSYRKEINIKDSNSLIVLFKSAIKEAHKKSSALTYELPGGTRVFTRKAAYQYGWDWAPAYISAGIWQYVKLQQWNTAIIRNIQTNIDTLTSEIARITLELEIQSDIEFKSEIKISGQNQSLKQTFKDIEIKAGKQNYSFQVEIKEPKLWWTHNLGKSFVYIFDIQLSKNNKLIDSESISLGLRTIELVREKDNFGESFYFKLNEIPVFMKGANYVPQSSFPGSVKDSAYRKIISDVAKANMNMLRVWGGGIYEKDIFYDLCDSLGIMVWQDFMFANAMYPGDSAFIEIVKKEAEYQLKRLNNHPSLAVWCGNNEIDEAWHNWGWSGNFSKSDSTEIWSTYQNIFNSILPETVKKISPKTPYTSSSPLFGRGNPRSSFEGDNHYWYVWHDGYDFDWYNKVTGRFMSEFGFQSFPSMKTIEMFDTSEFKTIDSGIMLAHQKHPKGNELIKKYMQDYYPIPDNFTDFVYISQLLQAEGIRTGILAQRRAKPFCMGSLYWQLNDCWPAISWSSIDYSGNWKALHYFASEDFKNIFISPLLFNDSLEIFVVSDSLYNFSAELNLKLMNFKGNVVDEWKLNLNIEKNQSQRVFKTSVPELLKGKLKDNNLLYIELINNNKILVSRKVYFEKPKDLNLEKEDIHFNFSEIPDGYEISLTSQTLIKNIFLEMPYDGIFSDNYFDIVPGIEKKIKFITKQKEIDIGRELKYKCLNNIIKFD